MISKIDKQQLQRLCQKLNLGELSSEPEKVTGGLLHRMYKISTSSGKFAVKKLNPTIKAKENIKKKYQYTEDIAALFSKRGIPAVLAYRFQNEPIIEIADDWFMVFDWVEGTTLSPEQIRPEHARKIGEMLFLMHSLNLFSKEKTAKEEKENGSSFDYFHNNHWKLLLEHTKLNHSLFLEIDKFFPVLLELNQKFYLSIPELNKKQVISHADLDPKNVLWIEKMNPIIIDWESVRPVNPTLELIACALDWSGITTGEINIALYQAVLDGYRIAGSLEDRNSVVIKDQTTEDIEDQIRSSLEDRTGDVIEDPSLVGIESSVEDSLFSNDIKTACYGVAGNWLAWLEFNIRRAIGENSIDEDDKNFGVKMSLETINTLLRLNNFIKQIL